MFNEWGSPNTQVVVLIAFSLTLYQVIIKNKKLENNLIGKIIILVIIALFALFVASLVIFLLPCVEPKPP